MEELFCPGLRFGLIPGLRQFLSFFCKFLQTGRPARPKLSP